YVVGHATGSKTANFSAPFANDFNVLIADQASERNTSNLLNVQLTSAYRGAFGLSGHPELIGSKIRVTGALGAYNNFGGVKSPSALELVSGSEPGNPGDPGEPDPGTPGQPGTTLPDGKGKKVLFDNTHAQTAGAADWVIDGAFSDFAGGLRNAGFTVDPLNRSIPFTYGEQAITYDKLRPYDVF
ncbi:DNA-binding protein, partial [Paenibacillus sp. 28ISP30-2]|nr:DNA-binding protein [Paenibacillus sp. 28ISP30-2]